MVATAPPPVLDPDSTVDIDALDAVQRRVLWLSSLIVHWANKVRPNLDGMKVGGHQASSASCVSFMTALWFGHLERDDRVAVKPHASPVFHAIEYLLGNLSADHLKTLRAFGGLQSYPSRTKDPDRVDFSTGSVGLGAAATNYAALTRAYMRAHGMTDAEGRFYAIVGDAELDEGSVWETISEPLLDDVPGVRWIIDLNRQSLDRVIPGIRVNRFREMFRANGWRVIDVKYGHRLTELFGHEAGDVLRRRIDEMSNEEYQALISGAPERVRPGLLAGLDGRDRSGLERVLAEAGEEDLRPVLAGLGGHDLRALLNGYREADAEDGPAVVFAYTVKGWHLPFAGDPSNHSLLLTAEQMDALAADLAVGADWFAPLVAGEAGADLVAATRNRLARDAQPATPSIAVPESLPSRPPKTASTQEAFGRVLTELERTHADVAARVVTASPDVATSTNLGAWINKAGVWSPQDRRDWSEGGERLIRWQEGPTGRHLELGISEMNLFLALGQLGLASELSGGLLLPIGTVYDPFVCRGLDAFIYALYQEARFVVVGTPSGITLAPEGGAHQSTITPSIGLELPNLVTWEPCFAKEVEWVLLDAMRAITDRTSGHATYLRLSTRPIEQELFAVGDEPAAHEARRGEVLSGMYRLVDSRTAPGYTPEAAVLLFATGAVVPEAVAASADLLDEGVFASVFNVTSPDLVYRRWQDSRDAMVRTATHQDDPFDVLDSSERGRPAVTVIDGHPHSLAFLGTALGVRMTCLGVNGFGQSGTIADLYRYYGIDAAAIVTATIAML